MYKIFVKIWSLINEVHLFDNHDLVFAFKRSIPTKMFTLRVQAVRHVLPVLNTSHEAHSARTRK